MAQVSSFPKLLLIAAALNGLTWVVLIPLWQYPDEQAHFAQVQDVAELGRVPVGEPNTSREIALSEEILGTVRDAFGNNKFTYHPQFRTALSDSYEGPGEAAIKNLPHQAKTDLVKLEATNNPPLYYRFSTIAYRLFSSSDLFTRVYATRLISLFFFLIIILVSYRIGKLIFPQSEILAPVLATLVAYKPMLVFSSTGVLPDSLVILLFTLVLYISLKILRVGLKARYLTAAAFVMTLGVLTRQQFLLSLFIVVFPIAYQVLKNPRHLGKFVLFLILIPAFITAVNLFGTKIPLISSFRINDVGFADLDSFSLQSFYQHLVYSINTSLGQTLPWYWGVYKWLSLTLPSFTYQIINRMLLVAALGLLTKLAIDIKKMKLGRKFWQQNQILLFLIYSSLVYYLIFIVWDYFHFLKVGFHFGIQGRYLLPLVVFHLAIILIALKETFSLISKKYLKFVLVAIVFLMIVFNNVSLAFVSASYYDASSVEIFLKQASQYKPSLIKGLPLIFLIMTNLTLQSFLTLSLIKIARRGESQSLLPAVTLKSKKSEFK